MLTENDLPTAIGLFDAVEAAYPKELVACQEGLQRGLPVLISCDKELVPYFYKCLRDRLKVQNRQCIYLDGRPDGTQAQPVQSGVIASSLRQLESVVRGVVDERVVILPHLDLLTTSSGGLTSEAKEVISLLYENPNVLWVGFRDPSFSIPRVIESLFPQQITILGTARSRLPYLVTQQESRKFGYGFDVYHLYQYVSGVNAVRLRRLLSSLQGEDYPENPAPAYQQIRNATLGADLSLPQLDLHKDIGGYRKVKLRLQEEILDVLALKDETQKTQDMAAIEKLIPRGMIFWGPPGTGKTLFAKAMASALGAAISIVSGPELKSRWVGESEARIRQIFLKARESAPAIIVFDELDSFAAARGTYTGSGVEHSMVNQLLTELDGFRQEELVFVIGTTNFVECIDPALLRPGRFEFHLEIPYPNAQDRAEIFQIYNQSLNISLSESALDYAVRLSSEPVASTGTPYSGDHIQGLCRAIARYRIRHQLETQTQAEDIEKILNQYLDYPQLTQQEEMIVATHEAGHAICALHCEHAPPVERISIRGDIGGALGFVQYADPAHRYVVSQVQLHDMICTLLGGREAERLLVGELSIGSAGDLQRATDIARALVTEYGMGDTVGLGYFAASATTPLSQPLQQKIDQDIQQVIQQQLARATKLIQQHTAELVQLRDQLLAHKTIDRRVLPQIMASEGCDG